MAPFSVQTISTRSSLDTVVDLISEGQCQPYMPHLPMYFPIDGYEERDFDRAISASKDRMWQNFQNLSPNERWIAVIDDATSRPVGCALWHKLSGSPAPNGCPRLDFYWLPAGPVKAFSEEMFQQIRVPRCLWMKRAHGDVSFRVVHPRFRGMGIGGMLMEWGNRYMDEDSLEGLIECTEAGRLLYRKWGYSTVMRIAAFVPDSEPTSLIRNKLVHDWKLPESYGYIMWRPPHGSVLPGQREKPWQ